VARVESMMPAMPHMESPGAKGGGTGRAPANSNPQPSLFGTGRIGMNRHARLHALELAIMTDLDLVERIAAYPRWHYAFDLRGHSTITPGVTRVRRHAHRLPYLLDPLVENCGGSLAGLRVLDLGCNAGFWSLAALRRDADFVLGVDARAMHLAQAALVFEVEGIEAKRHRFIDADLMSANWALWGRFDVVLCLGLLYHVGRPVELFARMAATGARHIVVDTALSLLPGAALEVRREPLDDPRNAIGSELVLWPTRDAVTALAADHGYEVRVLEPVFAPWDECEDYRDGRRRGFLLTRAHNAAIGAHAERKT